MSLKPTTNKVTASSYTSHIGVPIWSMPSCDRTEWNHGSAARSEGTPRTSPARHKYKSILWQLEPRTSPSSRERTTSTLSTASTQPSYTFVPDPEISSSFAASLESTQTSDAEEPVTSSPAHSSCTSSAEEQAGYRRRVAPAVSGHVSSVIQPHALSSFSSLESLHSPSERLLT
ncbi:hypothetical protein EDC04DRAFT_3147299 [Pisolithus marmoratus]|nr:hypothetical protein EDC04DRAFT_3147299 [Pisolithus marmoratus]